MRRRPLKAYSLVVRAACVLAASASVARAQSIEPRAYSNAPVGVNFLLAGLYYTRGGLSFDTSLPVTDPQLKTYNAVLGYAPVPVGRRAMIPVVILESDIDLSGEPRRPRAQRLWNRQCKRLLSSSSNVA